MVEVDAWVEVDGGFVELLALLGELDGATVAEALLELPDDEALDVAV